MSLTISANWLKIRIWCWLKARSAGVQFGLKLELKCDLGAEPLERLSWSNRLIWYLVCLSFIVVPTGARSSPCRCGSWSIICNWFSKLINSGSACKRFRRALDVAKFSHSCCLIGLISSFLNGSERTSNWFWSITGQFKSLINFSLVILDDDGNRSMDEEKAGSVVAIESGWLVGSAEVRLSVADVSLKLLLMLVFRLPEQFDFSLWSLKHLTEQLVHFLLV